LKLIIAKTAAAVTAITIAKSINMLFWRLFTLLETLPFLHPFALFVLPRCSLSMGSRKAGPSNGLHISYLVVRGTIYDFIFTLPF